MGIPIIALTEAVYYILLSLIEPLHGYGIMQNIEVLSSGRITLAAGTLYGAINTMLEKGWIKALPEKEDSRRKEYIITDLGQKVLEDEIVRLQELLSNGKHILGGVEMSWGYFRKKTDSSDFHLYSDNTSRINYLRF
ncbi:MAG TPA: PadR family transcriptional regulator [Epulopiscium sp.]|nr:PadR family transcriptional regulator [Candidatus Epulonipiscium sp.]